MSLLIGNVENAVPGLQGFDTAAPISAAAARVFQQNGFRFCARYLSRVTPQAAGDLSHAEAGAILSGGLSLMVVQHVMRAGWVPTVARGAQYGAAASTNAGQIGLPAGIVVWLDLEGVQAGIAGDQVIAYCNAWFDAVATAGFVPGIYVGANCGLDGDSLYWRLKTKHYWRSGSVVPDLPHRGYQLVQRIGGAADTLDGIAIDRDVTYTDAFADTAIWLAP